ncbi:signal peptidase I [Streptomyces sp. NBC_00378]|uniref:signal peptidase I n=1 Tax=unclassified Streptomyces TaxID=2593676 RepID=UPI002250775A|nr:MULTISPECIES: signal peptidase I [unclassified Streptomyces]MCX5109033.1 signal peptidase I [Streptomyces sp. NBC_00378]
MDTEAKPSERDRSSAPAKVSEEGSRSSRIPDLPAAISWRRTIALGAVCAVFVLLLSNYVVQPFLIPSGSMEPTLRVGDRVLVNKLAYSSGSAPQRGDVVVFDGTGSFVQEPPEQNPVTGLMHSVAASLGLAEPAATDYVKRVVGVGGDRVVCCDKEGRIEVNGRPVVEDYLHPGDAPSQVRFDIVVPDGTLWMMGDHRSNSRDSRDHLGEPGGGMVPVDMVIGRVDWIGWPPSRLGSLTDSAAFATIGSQGGGHG